MKRRLCRDASSPSGYRCIDSKGGDARLKYHLLRGQHEVCLRDQAQLELHLRYL